MMMFVVIVIISLQQTKHIHRDRSALMNKYYRLKRVDPKAAHRALLILLAEDSTYLPALKEASQWYLYNNNVEEALPILRILHERIPTEHKYTLQLAYLHYQNGQWLEAISLFEFLSRKSTGEIKILAQQAILSMKSYMPMSPLWSAPTTSNLQVRENVASLVKINSTNLTNKVQKKLSEQDAGYLSIREGNPCKAIDYFTKAYVKTYEPSLAMQLGYLYDQIDDKPTAYQYFKQASKSSDPKLALSANNAMTNLAGLQTRALPKPYFSEVFFNPFTQSRFGLTVRPLVVRLGIEQDNFFHAKQYAFFRRTDDNKSENLGQLSQIYEDNVQIIGFGGQIVPIKGIPLVGFLETGAAYDLVYRDRKRWRGDLRAGFMYYNEFGTRSAYFDNMYWSLNYYSDLYGDATYFTRYDNNVIAGVKTHQGLRLLQYHDFQLNLYATGRMITDTQRQFYNNFLEVGPGFELVPSNRFNVKIRFEHVNGVYLPAGASPNPYSKYYTNTLVQFLLYVKF